MAYEILFLAGRVLFGLFWIIAGFNHLTKTKALAGYAEAKGVPMPKLSVMVSGLLILFGGLSIVLGYYPYIGVLSLSLFLVPVTLMMHRFWEEKGDSRMSQMSNFLRNIALLGAALMLLQIPLPWVYSL
jgi:uncharacterized membrane protein YphA (DoxX/SURF4 family)